MSTHTVAETKNQLSKLIDRALKGEHIVVTRRGQPVIELKPVQSKAQPEERPPRGMSEAERGFLEALRALPAHVKIAAAAEVRRMREEGEE